MLRNLLLLMLVGCTPALSPESNSPVAVPIAQPMTMNPVQWQVMTSAQLRILANKLQKAQVVFLLDVQNYENLSLNIIEIERYIQEQKIILDMLKALIAQRAKSQDK